MGLIAHSGDPLRIAASWYNDVTRMLNWWKGSRIERLAAELEAIFPPSIIWIKNTTSSDLSRGDVLAIGDPVISLSENADFFKSRLEFEGTTPTSSSSEGKFAVLREPARRTNGFARAVASGVALVKLNITSSSDTYCEIANNVTGYLTTAGSGSARIIWKSSGTGSTDKWGFIRIGDPSGPEIYRGQTAEPIDKDDSGDVTRNGGGTDTVTNLFADVGTGKDCIYVKLGTTFYLIAAECPLT